jgi:integrase
MAVRKRTWKTSDGEIKEAWLAAYTDSGGRRRIKTFARKKEADHFAATAHIEVRQGTHTPDAATVTVAKAGEKWLASCEQRGLERTTIDSYRQALV